MNNPLQTAMSPFLKGTPDYFNAKPILRGLPSTALIACLVALCLLAGSSALQAQNSENAALNVIPYPQQVTAGGKELVLQRNLTIILAKNHSTADAFTAAELIRDL